MKSRIDKMSPSTTGQRIIINVSSPIIGRQYLFVLIFEFISLGFGFLFLILSEANVPPPGLEPGLTA